MIEQHPAPEAWSSGLVFLSALLVFVTIEAFRFLRRPPRKKNPR